MSGPTATVHYSLIKDSSVFQDCVDDFKHHVPPHVVQQFQHIASLEDLNVAIKDIERQQAANKSLRNLRKIEPFLKLLNEYSPIIETLANAKPDVLALIWGPVKFCLQVACKYGKAFDSLLSAYRKIQDALPSISSIEKLFSSHDIVLVVLQRVYTDILAFHQRAILFFSKPGWKMILQTTCRTFDDSFGDVLDNLQSSKQLLYTSADVASYLDAQKARTQAEQAFLDQQIRERQMRKVAIQSWLNANPHKNQHLELQSLRAQYPDTCGWLFKERAWTSWMAATSNGRQAFWISGIPGAGKTVLFSALVDEIRNCTKRTTDHSITVYLYCKYNDNARDNFVALTRSLINSLLEGDELCYDYLYDVAVNSNEQFATTINLLSNTVISLLQFYDHVYIGIDGLDEIEPIERAMMAKLMLQIMNLSDDDHLAHIFLTSRAEIDMERSFNLTNRFRLEANHVTDDIRRYVIARTQELSHLQVDQSVLDDLVVASVGRSAGMFLLAKLIFDIFALCANREDFDDELLNRNLPTGIEEAKRDELTRRPRAARLLEILAFSRRTLYLHEVQAALSIDLEKGDIDVRNRRYTQHLKEICGSIVEVNSDETVVLVHATAKQYLTQHHHDIFNISDAKWRLADICVAFLSMPFLRPDLEQVDLKLAASNGSFGLYRYAFCNWLLHVSQAVGGQESTLEVLRPTWDISKVLNTGFPVHVNLEEIDRDTHKTNENQFSLREQLSPLRMILEKVEAGNALADADFEFLDLALDHAKRVQDAVERNISQTSSEDDKRLLKAAYGNNPYLCNRLGCPRFNQGFSSDKERNNHAKTHLRPHKCSFSECDFSRTGFATKTALNNHLNLFHVEDLSLQFSQLDTRPLKTRCIEAIGRNHYENLELLCPQLANVAFTNREMRDLVFTAIQNDSIEAASMLVKHHRSARALFDYRYPSLLVEAASARHARTLRALLSRLAEVGATVLRQVHSNDCPRALQKCVEHRNLDCLEVILQYKGFRGIAKKDPDMIPVLSDFPSILPLLLSDEISARTPVQRMHIDYSEFLQDCVQHKFVDCLEFILGYIYFRNVAMNDPDMISVLSEFPTLWPVLLLSESNTNMLSESNTNMLMRNDGFYCCLEILRQCVKHEYYSSYLEIMLQYRCFRHVVREERNLTTILSEFATILPILLSRGMDGDDPVIGIDTALQKAIETNDVAMVKLLLDAHVSMIEFDNSISEYPSSNDISRVELVGFMDTADANYKDSSQTVCSPLCASACLSRVEIMRMLIDNGADVNHCRLHSHLDGSTPLHQAIKLWQQPSIRFLLCNGADHTIENSMGQTALNMGVGREGFLPLRVLLASSTGAELISDMELFISKGAICETGTGMAPILGLTYNRLADLDVLSEALKVMITYGADIDKVDNDDRSVRRRFTLMRPELLERAGIALWKDPMESIEGFNDKSPDQITEEGQCASGLPSQAENIDLRTSSSGVDPESRIVPGLCLASDQALSFAFTATSGLDIEPQSPVTRTDQVVYSYDWPMEELDMNPWIQEEATSQPYQYTPMEGWS